MDAAWIVAVVSVVLAVGKVVHLDIKLSISESENKRKDQEIADLKDQVRRTK